MQTVKQRPPASPLLGQIDRPAVFRTNRIAPKPAPADKYPRGVLADLSPINCKGCGAYHRSECFCRANLGQGAAA